MNLGYIEGFVQNSVTSLIRNLTDFDEIYSDTSLVKDMGCDQLDVIELIMAIEHNLNITISDDFYLQGESENACLNNSLTVKNLIDYCVDQVADSIGSKACLSVDPLPQKPNPDSRLGIKATSEIDYDKALQLFDDCAESNYIPLGISLEETYIDSERVIEYIIQNSSLDLHDAEYELEDFGDGYAVSVECTTVFNWQNDIEQVNTLEELAEELSKGFDENIEIPSDNYFDWIAYSCSPCDWYCENNSIQFAGLNCDKFVTAIKDRYGIPLNHSTISGYQGTIGMFLNNLVEYINQRLE